MLNNRLAAAKLLAEKIAACENAIDDALISAAELTSATPLARRQANLSPIVGQEALALTGEALTALHQARAKMVSAHMAFAEVRDQIGLGPYATGDMWKLPSATANPLKIVSDKAA